MERASSVGTCHKSGDRQLRLLPRAHRHNISKRKEGQRGRPVPFCWRLSPCLLFYTIFAVGFFGTGADAFSEVREQRTGSVAGLEEGRMSLARLHMMMVTSAHVELAGSQDAFGRLLDHEWERLSSLPANTRAIFVVCGEPGRKSGRRLRELAGADSLVETLHRKRGAPTCSVASLDSASAALVAAEGGGKTFALEPLPHLAKLAPSVAADPSHAALLLSSEALVAAGGHAAVAYDEGGGVRRLLGAHRREKRGQGDDAEADRMTLQQRARVLASDASASSASPPSTQRLIDEGVRGLVDALEVTLVLHHERRKRADTEQLARKWLSLADDQAALATVLGGSHFWAKGAHRDGERGSLADEASSSDEETARHVAAHESSKRSGWSSLLGALHDGRGGKREHEHPQDQGQEAVGSASCGFAHASFTVAPSGKKILFDRPHELAARAAEHGGGGVGADNGCLSALLALLSLQPEVHYVTARRKTATMNLDAAWVTQSGVEDFTPLWDEDLQGQDEIIGVADTGVDMNHCHFREDDGDSIEPSDYDNPIVDTTKRKIVQYIDYVDDFDEFGGHGTHVAGTLAGAQSGDSAGDDEGDGMAYQGKLAVFDFGDSENGNALSTPSELDEVMFEPAYDAGARVHSNSWDTVSVEYTSLSKEVDEFVYTHQDFLVVFAAGNCGDTSLTDDLVDNCDSLETDGGTVLSPAQAKNVIAVGSSESGGTTGKDMNTVSYFSSKGLTNDGRIKPDVVAPGDPTWSAFADESDETCEFGEQTGTSMATPVVAGNAAVARQYFREGWYNTGTKNLSAGFEPSAALLKAVLINSAVGMESVGVNPETSTLDETLSDPPDEHQGHGRINMVNGLNVNSSVGLFFRDWIEISQDETVEFDVSLYEDADTDKDLRVTLVWTDPAAATGSTSALIHDLDLVVTAQSTGTTYYPNGNEEADGVNNVEKVIITDTTANETYTMQVTCVELSESDTQSFALVANGEFIKTNALPITPDPDDWLDLIDQAADDYLTWENGLILSLGILACCALTCACRRCQRNRRHKIIESRYRHAIVNNRGVQHGRKIRPPAPSRPHPYPGPIRGPGELMITGSQRYDESWRRRGPGSVGGRSSRSSRSDRSSRLTGAGALVPPDIHSDSTTPPTPPHEACPECGLRLPDVLQLVSHVETKHGGRATRRHGSSTASSSASAKEPVVAMAIPVATVTVAPSKKDASAIKVERGARDSGDGGGKKSCAGSCTSDGRQNASVVRNAVAVGEPAATAAITAGASKPRGNSRQTSPEVEVSKSRKRSKSPELSESGTRSSLENPDSRHSDSGHNTASVSSGQRSRSPDVTSSARRNSASAPESRRDALPRLKDVARVSADGRRNEVPVGSVSIGSTVTAASRRASAGASRDTGDRRESSRCSRGAGSRGEPSRTSRGSSPDRDSERILRRPRSVRGHAHVDSRGVQRTESLDRLSALSSRAFTRPSGGVVDERPSDAASEAAATAPARNEAGEPSGGPPADGRRVTRRMASYEDFVPLEGRLSVEALGRSGAGQLTFSPVMSPTHKPKEPLYSPVARARAGELDAAERPVSLRRKFLRQLSGDL